MKTGKLMMVAVILLAGSITMKSVAQDNIKALIKKCENMDVIDANIVRNKKSIDKSTTFPSQSVVMNIRSNTDSISFFTNNVRSSITQPVTRTHTIIRSQYPRSIVNLTLKYTPELEKELVTAFRKDQENATREVEQKKDGKVTHMLYQFDDSEYSFTIKNDTISIQATEGRSSIVTSPLAEGRPVFTRIDSLRQKQLESTIIRYEEMLNLKDNMDSTKLKEYEIALSRLKEEINKLNSSLSETNKDE